MRRPSTRGIIGWYDGNPANLHPLTPVETGKKTVEYMGGAEAMLKRARADFAAGQLPLGR